MENVVYDVGQSAGRCGYCDVSSDFYRHGRLSLAHRKHDTEALYDAGMLAQSSMTVNVYQDLLDLGWRRSGTYLYKPDLRRMCCPTYTIRLNVNDFVPSKAQKKTMRRWEQYLNGGALAQRYQPEKTSSASSHIREDTMLSLMKLLLTDVLDVWLSNEEAKVSMEVTVGRPSTKQRKALPETAFLSSPMCITLFHALKSQLKRDVRWRSPADLAENFVSHFEDSKESLWRDRIPQTQQPTWMRFVQKMSVHSANGYLNFHLPKQEHLPEQEEIAQWLQSLHASDPRMPISSQLTEDVAEMSDDSETVDSEMTSLPNSFCLPSQKRHLVLSIAPSSFVEEEYQLYKKYQMQVHGDSATGCSRRQYADFLIDTPLVYVSSAEGRPEMGSFHMQYRIDDHLVAVGVVDILPRCLSSKYFFWDPDFAQLALGKVSAMSEIEWVQKAQRSFPDLQYYYMGYYIQSCPKMRYKGDYEPSELLCPESHQWVSLTDDIRKQLQDNAYRNLSGIPGAMIRENMALSLPALSDVCMQRVCIFGNGMTFEAYLQLLNNRRQQGQRRSWLEWRSPNSVSRLQEISDLLTPVLEKWRSQTGRVANALIYNCAALESIVFSGHDDDF